MKSEGSQFTLNQFKFWTQCGSFDSRNLEKPLCPGKNQATHLCLNSKCEALNGVNQKTVKTIKNSFICSNDKCQVCCYPGGYQCDQSIKQAKTARAHVKCFIGDYKRMLSCIQQKKKDCSPLKESTNKMFDDFIEYISDLRQKCLNELKYYGLSQNQQKFLVCFNKKQFEQITPELSLQIVNQLPNQSKDNVVKAQKMLERYWKQQEIKSNELFQLIGKNISKKEVDRIEGVTMDSKVVICEKEQLDLIKMLQDQQNKTVKELTLLYRASQNYFSVKKFHQKCDFIEHTVVVIQTEHGKKIGGYTPLVWKKNISVQYQQDSSGKSFVFSLTTNHKLTLLKSQEQKAIRQRSDYGPPFGPIFGGGPDIRIVDKGNKNNCEACVGSSYTHPEYQHDKASWRKFSGAITDYCFKIKEWEVFQVQWN